MRWSNWYENLECAPQAYEAPADEQAVAAAVTRAREAGMPVRAVGGGHSNTPLVPTDGLILSLDRLRGIAGVGDHTVTLLAGTRIGEASEALWEHGLAFANQGDIDTQAIAGATATGTHGTGLGLTNFGGMLRGARLVTADGGVLDVGSDLLDAARTSVGALGVFTSLTVEVVDAYCLERTWRVIALDELRDCWRDLLRDNRHCTVYWNPYEHSSAMFGLPPAPADSILVKTMNPRPAGAPRAGSGAHDDPAPSVDRSYRVFADEYEPDFAELEYMIPLEDTVEAIARVRELMQRHHPDEPFPVEVRFTAGDGGWLSPSYGRETCVVSCSGRWAADREPYLRDCDALLAEHDGRPHWGKLAFSAPERLERAFPRLADFRRIRRSLDPDGVFMNAHLRELLG